MLQIQDTEETEFQPRESVLESVLSFTIHQTGYSLESKSLDITTPFPSPASSPQPKVMLLF